LEADLNVRLQLIVRKRWALSRQNDLRGLAYKEVKDDNLIKHYEVNEWMNRLQ